MILSDVKALNDVRLDMLIARSQGWDVSLRAEEDWICIWVTESRDAIHKLAYAFVTDFPDGISQWYLSFLVLCAQQGWRRADEKLAWATPREMCEAYLLTRERLRERNRDAV